MTTYRSEYRITKKGAECFRSTSYEETRKKYAELSVKRPDVYAMQCRRVQVDRYGSPIICGGKPLWSAWN